MLANNRMVETDDLSPEGLFALIEQYQEPILDQMDFMEARARHRAHNSPLLAPSLYVARMSRTASEVIAPKSLNHHLKLFSKEDQINEKYTDYWRALARTSFRVYAGTVDQRTPFDGVWLGIHKAR